MFHGRYLNIKNVVFAKLNIFIIAVLSVVVLSTGTVVYAQEATEGDWGARVALDAHDQITDEFSRLQFREKTQEALNSLVGSGVQALRNAGYDTDAEKFENEWNGLFDDFLYTIGGLNLGDHEPLNQWLADFYSSLQSKLGDRLMQMLHLDDIHTLNYALPVVFQPRGDSRTNDHWDRVEYGLHFVPFAGIVTYWASYIGCVVATQEHPSLRRFCGQVASILKTGMRRSVAPKLSDLIYNSVIYGDASAELNIDLVNLRENYEVQISRLPR